MTKLIAFADIHGHVHNLQKLIPVIEQADYGLFLGDGISCLETLPDHLNKKLRVVKGNCDFFMRVPDEQFLEIEGKKIFITHGHNYGVKRSNSEIKKIDADLILYGHMHEYQVDGHVIGVPPLGDSRTTQGGSYLEILIDGDNINCNVKRV